MTMRTGRRLRRVLVRTWNLFHGNASPPERRAFLREMVELACSDDPDVVCLQEIPVWATPLLGRWSGMHAVHAVARGPRLPAARTLTGLHHGILRSALTGEAGAVLTRGAAVDLGATVVSESGLRRIVQRVRLEDGTVVANVHITGVEEQWRRVLELVADEPRAIVAGDANIPSAGLPGYSTPLPDAIDQILVRGLPSSPPAAWPVERRTAGGRVLSDHAPVELHVG
jgi:endonuclease/exonuclease/phosphatase family metal-dependent hydrolase